MSELITRHEQLITRQGEQVAQMEQIVQVVVRLVAEVERLDREMRRQVTVSHRDALAIGRAISSRSKDYAAQYHLEPEQAKKIRKAIKRDVLKRWSICDLHDLPEREKETCVAWIGEWADFALIAELKREHRDRSACA